MSQDRGQRKRVVGVVISDRMQKSCTVEVERREKHPLYGKYLKRSSRFKVHDEENAARVGDTVEIMETKPLSKTKRWRLVAVRQRGVRAET